MNCILLAMRERQSKAYYIPYLDTVPYTLEKNIDKGSKQYLAVDKKSVEEKAVVEITESGISEDVVNKYPIQHAKEY